MCSANWMSWAARLIRRGGVCMQYEQHMSASVLPPLSWQGLVTGKIVRLILLMRAHDSSTLHCPSPGFKGSQAGTNVWPMITSNYQQSRIWSMMSHFGNVSSSHCGRSSATFWYLKEAQSCTYRSCFLFSWKWMLCQFKTPLSHKFHNIQKYPAGMNCDCKDCATFPDNW